LFLDADILAARDLNHIFSNSYEHERLYVKINKQKVSFSSHSGVYHGLKHLTNDQLEQMKLNNQMPFNAGQFLFLNSNKMRKHFENVNWLMSVWPGPYFFEQSFMNHYFCLYNLTDNQKFGSKVKLISTVEPHLYNPKIDNDDILIHFIAPALNATAKVNFITEYKNAHFPH
jgi:lipopolysaccharide biosynthesis glycosyltransferase